MFRAGYPGSRLEPHRDGSGEPVGAAPGPAELEALARGGWFEREGWLGRERALEARAALLARLGSELAPAGVGRGARHVEERAARGDEIAWLDLALHGALPGIEALLASLEALRVELAQGLRLALPRTELQLSRYVAPGARYLRHRDAFRGGGNRLLTAVYYLNPDWRPEHGGCLRVHGPEGPRDLEPRLDRLVVFVSEQLEHEVLPVHHPRLALTAWFGRDDPLGRLR